MPPPLQSKRQPVTAAVILQRSAPGDSTLAAGKRLTARSDHKATLVGGATTGAPMSILGPQRCHLGSGYECRKGSDGRGAKSGLGVLKSMINTLADL